MGQDLDRAGRLEQRPVERERPPESVGRDPEQETATRLGHAASLGVPKPASARGFDGRRTRERMRWHTRSSNQLFTGVLSMRLQRLVVGVLGAALLGAVPVALTATSAAGRTTGPQQTRIKPTVDARPTASTGTARRSSSEATCRSSARPATRTVTAAAAGRDRTTSSRCSGRMAGLVDVEDPRPPYDADDGTFTFSPTSARQRPSTRSATPAARRPSYSRRRRATAHRRARGTRTARASSPAVRLYYRGNVDPGWGRKPVTIQKKTCKLLRAGAPTRPCARTQHGRLQRSASTRRPAAAGSAARS